jgi:hypothetical protein
MNKLKTQNSNYLLNYQHFFKNNSLKRKKYKLKNIIFENQILYKNYNLNLNIIELKNSENIQIPSTVIDLKDIYTIKSVHNNRLLFNYNLSSTILENYNEIMLKLKEKKDRIVKARTIPVPVTLYKQKNSRIFCLGKCSGITYYDLNSIVHKQRRIFLNKFYSTKYKTKNFKKKFDKKLKVLNNKLITSTLMCFHYKIKKKKTEEGIFSRFEYIKEILEYLPIQKLKIKLERRLLALKKKVHLKDTKKKILFEKIKERGVFFETNQLFLKKKLEKLEKKILLEKNEKKKAFFEKIKEKGIFFETNQLFLKKKLEKLEKKILLEKNEKKKLLVEKKQIILQMDAYKKLVEKREKRLLLEK